MSKFKMIALEIILVLCVLSFRIQAAEESWKSLGQFQQFIYFFDPASLTHPAKDIVRLSTKEECADKKECRELHKKWIKESKGQLSPAYENWAYRINSMEIHCKNKKIRFLTVKNIDNQGKKIDSGSDQMSPQWMDVKNPWNQPDPYEALYQIVCK